MAMSCRDRVMGALHMEAMDRPAAAIFTTCDTVGMQKACNVFWPEAHSDAKLMAKLGTAEADYFGLEAVRAGFCLTEEAEALGCRTDMGSRNGSPSVKEHVWNYNPQKAIYEMPKDVDLPSVEEFLNTKRVKVTIDAMAIMQKTHGDRYCVLGGNTGPFTLAGHCLVTEQLVYSVWTEPERAQVWTKEMAKYVKAFGKAMLDNGADVIQMSEPSASTDILAPTDFTPQSGQFVKDSLGSLNGYKTQDGRTGHSVLHICGDSEKIIPLMLATGVNGISVEEKVDSYTAIKVSEGKGAMIGNVGCSFPLFKGTPEDVAAASKKSADAGFNSVSAGCGVPIGTPDDNIRALVSTVKALGKD